MEIFGARTTEPIQTCVEEVKKSNIFIGILGMRYGSIDSESGKSFVQIEYETALKENIETLIYVIDEDKALISPVHVDKNENAKKLQEFKKYLGDTHTVEKFTTPDDLANKIERDLVRLMREKDIAIDQDKLEPLSDDKTTIEIIKKFWVMPKRLDGTEIELIIEFTNSPFAIDQKICRALKLTYGASVQRRIKIIEPNDDSVRAYSVLKNLYAEDDLCEFLYRAENSKPYKIIAKLSFGYVQEIHEAIPAYKPHPIKDLETGEMIDSYIRYHPIEALIMVRPII